MNSLSFRYTGYWPTNTELLTALPVVAEWSSFNTFIYSLHKEYTNSSYLEPLESPSALPLGPCSRMYQPLNCNCKIQGTKEAKVHSTRAGRGKWNKAFWPWLGLCTLEERKDLGLVNVSLIHKQRSNNEDWLWIQTELLGLMPTSPPLNFVSML